ncbi:DUF2690 domain-containing protein [Kribbella steppae]|uniref:DUF2690 domain-containing protein n=1 Tax=Kribbella steppae TaxID=2512223 RepID=UPI00104EC30D
MRRLSALIALPMTVSTLLVAPASTAAAACAYGCDGRDPIATGCAADARTVASAPVMSSQYPYGIRYGTINLRWSPSCQANWGQLVLTNPNNPGHWFRTIWIERWYGTSGVGWTRNEFTFSGTGSPIWGNMLYAPQCARAGVYMQVSGASPWDQADGTTVAAC